MGKETKKNITKNIFNVQSGRLNGKRYLHRFVCWTFLPLLRFFILQHEFLFLCSCKCNNNSLFSFIFVHFFRVSLCVCWWNRVFLCFNLKSVVFQFGHSFGWPYVYRDFYHFTKIYYTFFPPLYRLFVHRAACTVPNGIFAFCLICRHRRAFIRLHCHRYRVSDSFVHYSWTLSRITWLFICFVFVLQNTNSSANVAEHTRKYDNLLAGLVLQNSLS